MYKLSLNLKQIKSKQIPYLHELKNPRTLILHPSSYLCVIFFECSKSVFASH